MDRQRSSSQSVYFFFFRFAQKEPATRAGRVEVVRAQVTGWDLRRQLLPTGVRAV